MATAQTITLHLVPRPVTITSTQRTLALTIEGARISDIDTVFGYVVSRLAATGAVSALRVVRKDAAGDLQYCDGDTAAHAGTALGVSMTAIGAGGGNVSVVTSGRLSDASWAWTIGSPVYVGASGALTQDASVPTAFVQEIGVADSATSIVVAVKSAVTKG